MSMMTAEQYEDSLRELNLVVYMFGKKLDNVVADPIIRPSMQAVAKTYELAHLPEHEDRSVMLRQLLTGKPRGDDQALSDTWDAIQAHGECGDMHEGSKAFVEKRKPNWAPYTGK